MNSLYCWVASFFIMVNMLWWNESSTVHLTFWIGVLYASLLVGERDWFRKVSET